MRKINSEVTVSANISAILNNLGLERENSFLARPRVTFAVFRRGINGIDSRASNRCNDYWFYEIELGEKLS